VQPSGAVVVANSNAPTTTLVSVDGGETYTTSSGGQLYSTATDCTNDGIVDGAVSQHHHHQLILDDDGGVIAELSSVNQHQQQTSTSTPSPLTSSSSIAEANMAIEPKLEAGVQNIIELSEVTSTDGIE